MSSSNSYNFAVTRDQLITDSLLYIGAIAESETPTTAAISEAARLLNMIVKLRAADGMPLWALKRAPFLPEPGVFNMNPLGLMVSGYINPTIRAVEPSGQPILPVPSSTER